MIRAPKVRLLDEQGEMLGVMSSKDAFILAKEKELDLVEISPKADPPVCKIIDYGKMLYALKKKDQKAKQATKAKEMKGVRITFAMAQGDMDRQGVLAKKFLKDGHPVRVQLRLRGRERAHMNLAYEKIKAFLADLGDCSKVDQNAKSAGGQIVATLAPYKKKKEDLISNE
jgi:translation initiation factor IF-3